jgi:low affinity Fe/Cu permease
MLTDEQLDGLVRLIVKYVDKLFVGIDEKDLNKLCERLREYYATHAGAEAGAAQVR